MTEDELIAMGGCCDLLLQAEWFKAAVHEFDQQCFYRFMQTQPAHKMEREGVYHQWQGARDFLAHLAAYVEQAQQAAERNAALSQVDARIAGID